MPGMAEAMRPDKIDRLKELDDEIGRLQQKRRNVTWWQIAITLFIFFCQGINLAFFPTPTGNEDIDFAIKWSWPIWILVLGVVIITWGSIIGKQISRKIDEFFEELRS